MEKQMQTGGIKRHKKTRGQCKPYYWFTVTAPNNKILATSETYKSVSGMEKGIKSLLKVLACAT